jgi:hypothetical protein
MNYFEWDEKKRESNLEKHKIDFVDAKEIFLDAYRLELQVIKNNETRFQTIGKVNEVILFVVYTRRNQKARIISARRASKNERKIYET